MTRDRALFYAARGAWIFTGFSCLIALAATLWFIGSTLTVRLPYWGEAEVVFEASRLRAHLPLYVDPIAGAQEYGAPPSRYYVTYPPLWTWVVSRVPEHTALLFSRIASTVAWLGALVMVTVSSRRDARRHALAATTFIAGIWVLANFATIGRPDAMGCAIAAVALVRVVRKGSVDLVSVAMFVLVPWVKPTLIGLPVGALLGTLAVGPPTRTRRVLGAAALLAAAGVLVAHLASHGALLAHVVRSNAQPFTLSAWLEQVPTRLPFFAPLFGWAFWAGWRDRESPGVRIGLAALAASVLWTLFALAKTGSSSNYWMEPCIAAAVLIAQARPLVVRPGWPALALAAFALTAAIWTDVASVRAALEHTRSMRREAEIVRSLRTHCGAQGGEVIAADEAGIELLANGRILTPTYQMVHLVRSGAYPAAPWLADLTSPQTRCFVEHTGQLRLAPALQRTLEQHFAIAEEDEGFRLWTRQPSPRR